MTSSLSRRSFFSFSSLLLAPAVGRTSSPDIVRGDFPAHEAELVQEVVVVAHGQVARLKELVSHRPALAKATYDWGFGDWESALDAASHVGNREIAEFLIEHGARPTIFSAAMLGNLDAVKAHITASPGVQRIKGPHSITLLRHAMAGGPRAQSVVDYLKTVEGADERPTDKPLTPEEVKKLVGIYPFGVTSGQRIEITADNNNRLSFLRPGRHPRNLTHLGSYEFVPVGAEHVRVRFADSGSSVALTVHDPDVVCSAKKTV